MADQTFTSGQILTAAQMTALQSNIGLTFIKSQALSGTSNTITSAFSTSFQNYKIIIGGGALASIGNISMRLGTTAANYYSTRIKNSPNSGSPGGNGLDNTAEFSYAGQGSPNYVNLNLDVLGPFESKYTRVSGTYLLENGSSSEFGITQGHLADTTSYTAFLLTTGAALTGTIYVYGYRNP